MCLYTREKFITKRCTSILILFKPSLLNLMGFVSSWVSWIAYIRAFVPSRVNFFSPGSSPQAYYFIKKETLAQVFSSEFCKISNNTFSYLQNTSGGCFWAMLKNNHRWLSKFIFNWELLVTDNARSISKHMLLLKGFLHSLGVTLNAHE